MKRPLKVWALFVVWNAGFTALLHYPMLWCCDIRGDRWQEVYLESWGAFLFVVFVHYVYLPFVKERRDRESTRPHVHQG